MRFFSILLLLLALPSWALSQPAPIPADCPSEGKSWGVLLRDFIDHWQKPNSDFCEFKRFIAMNASISSDMRLDAVAYEAKLKTLEAYNDQIEAVNYLTMAFQETWFRLFIDASLDREFDRGKARWTVTGVGMGSLAAFAVALPFTRQYSAKSFPVLRAFVTNYLSKRLVVFGLTSTARASSHLSLGTKPQITTGFVRPPMLDQSGDNSDLRTRDIFVNRFWEDIASAGLGMGSGWIAGHYASLAVKRFVPKWAYVFKHGLAGGRFLDVFSPGVVAGAAVAYVVTDYVAQAAANEQFRERAEGARAELISLARKTNAAVKNGDEYQVWLNGEQLRNGLLLQNYLLTREFKQSVMEEQERSIRNLVGRFSDCATSRQTFIDSERATFQKRIAKHIKTERNSLEAALDITQEVEGLLLDQRSPMTEPLVGYGNELIESDKWFLDAAEITKDMFANVEAAVAGVKVDCRGTGGYP